MLLFSLYACKKENTSAENEEEIEEVEEEDSEDIEEGEEIINGSYTPESNRFVLNLPKGNWRIDWEEEGIVSLQSEDEQSYFEIAYLSEEDAEGALGETPQTREELEEQISYGEVKPTVVSFDDKTEGGVKRTIYALKYADGDYPYMVQGNYEKDGEFFTVIAMSKQQEDSILSELQKSIEQFEILN